MTLTTLAIRNVKRNFKQYFLYFVSMIFSIMMYFIFRTIASHSQLLAVAADEPRKIPGMFIASSILLVIFVSIFIIYSNSFFLKQRKQEVGIYALLGVQKKQIAKMLFYENFIMGIVALVIGIVNGSILSKFFIVILLRFMNVNVPVNFEITGDAIWNTVFFFLGITLFTAIQGYSLIYRFKIIDLFQAKNKGEKKPKHSPFLSIISIICLVIGYALAFHFLEIKLYIERTMGTFLFLPLFILLITILGTYILFHFLTVYVVQTLRNRKRFLYNGMNIISTSQLLYRLKGNATSLATIATLSAVTICAIGVSVSMYFNVEIRSSHEFPYSYSYEVKDADKETQVNETLRKYETKNKVEHDFTVTMSDMEVAAYDNKEMVEGGDGMVFLVSRSMYEEFAKAFSYKPLPNLKENETIRLRQPLLGDENRKPYNWKTISFAKENKTYSFELKEEYPYPMKNFFIFEAVVVPDHVYKELKRTETEKKTRVISVENQKHSKELSESLEKIITNDTNYLENYYRSYTRGMEDGGIMIFIGSFLGLVFLLATGSIIYFKQLAEAHEYKESFDMLRKIGATEKEIKRSIQIRMLCIFIAPLLVAGLHSLFALNTAKTIFSIIDVTPILWSVVLYVVIYMGYYVATVKSYLNIIKKERSR